MRKRHALSVTFLTLFGPACGDVGKLASPRLIPGGGVGDGKIAGALNVYVTDEDTRAPVSSAAVRIGASADPSACQKLTNSAGLVSFDTSCALLKGPVDVTASAAGFAPSTWIGVDGVNLTVPIRAMPRPDVERATVSGTITGWSSLAAPALNHQTLALIGASLSADLGDRGDNLPQGTRTVTLLGGPTTTAIPANACVRNAAANDCDWRLTTRTGAQAHFAVIVDQDTKGTTDDSDDTSTVIGWAVKTNLAFSAGDVASGETLAMIADADMQTFTAAFGTAPSGTNDVTGYPELNLGPAGSIPIILPVLDPTHLNSRVPKAVGPLAAARYDLIAQAQQAANQAVPSTLSWQRGVNPSKTVAVSTWMAPPTGLSTTAGLFSFSPVLAATLHTAELRNPAGERVWSVTIFDGSASFTLPGVAPDPVPTGPVTFSVSALQIPGIDLGEVQFDVAKAVLSGVSTDELTFTR